MFRQEWEEEEGSNKAEGISSRYFILRVVASFLPEETFLPISINKPDFSTEKKFQEILSTNKILKEYNPYAILVFPERNFLFIWV